MWSTLLAAEFFAADGRRRCRAVFSRLGLLLCYSKFGCIKKWLHDLMCLWFYPSISLGKKIIMVCAFDWNKVCLPCLFVLRPNLSKKHFPYVNYIFWQIDRPVQASLYWTEPVEIQLDISCLKAYVSRISLFSAVKFLFTWVIHVHGMGHICLGHTCP